MLACHRLEISADVLPVAAEVVRIHTAAILQQVGNDVLAKVVLGVGVSLVLAQVFLQDVPVEDVDAHGRPGWTWAPSAFPGRR